MYNIWDKVYCWYYEPFIVEIRSKRKLWFLWYYYLVWINNKYVDNWEEYERDLIPFN